MADSLRGGRLMTRLAALVAAVAAVIALVLVAAAVLEPDPAELDRLAAGYAPPGAFAAAIGWYRAGAGAMARSRAGADAC
jgi:uncharacterized membrane protein YdjX (TVP38/TMEM64 family)